MSYEVRANQNREAALVIARGPATVTCIRHGSEGLAVVRVPAEEFDSAYRILPMSHGHQSAPQDYARWALDPDSMIANWPPVDPLIIGILVWLLALDSELFEQHGVELPATRRALVNNDGTFLGVFAIEDVPLVKRAYPHAHGLNLSASDAGSLPAVWHDALRHSLDLAPAKVTTKSIKEIMMTAAQAKKPGAPAKPKKAEKTAKERAARGDGPVAKIHAFLDENKASIKGGAMSRKDAREALEKKGLSKGTISVQIIAWIKKTGIAFKEVKKEAAPKGKGKESGAATKAASAKAKAKPSDKDAKTKASAARGAAFAEKMREARAKAKAKGTTAIPAPGATVAAA